MSGHRERGHVRGSSDPLIINRSPLVIDRTPTATVTVAAPRVSSETRTTTTTTSTRPRSLNLYRVYNPFSRNRHNSNVIVQTTVRRQRGETSSNSPRASDRRGTRGSPPPPPSIHRRARSLSPSRTTTMPNAQGLPFVPLPPTLPTDEERRAERKRGERERRERGRGGRESRQSHADIVEIIDEPQSSVRRRSPRPYSHRPTGSDPRENQEQVIPPSPRDYEYVTTTTNDPVRSREIRNSKEYRDLQALANHNKKAADDAAQRCSKAEVRLQNIQKQLAESTIRENKAVEQSEQYRRESMNLRRELEKSRAEVEMLKREHRLSSRERDVAEEQLSHERQQTIERERERLAREDREREREEQRERERERDRVRDQDRSRDRPRDGSGSGSGNNTRADGGNGGQSHRRRRRVVIQHDRSDREPRSTPESVAAQVGMSTDSGMDAINQARAEARMGQMNRSSR